VTFCQPIVVLVSFLQLSFLFQIYNFRVVDTDRAPESFRSYNFINEVHGLCWQLNALDGLPLALIGVKVANGMWVPAVEGASGHHVIVSTTLNLELSLFPNWNNFLVFETRSGHRSFVLFLLKRCHDFILLNTSKVLLVSNSIIRIDTRLRRMLR